MAQPTTTMNPVCLVCAICFMLIGVIGYRLADTTETKILILGFSLAFFFGTFILDALLAYQREMEWERRVLT